MLARLLARRVIANEALARQRGVDLKNQTMISQRVLEEMQGRVLVLGRDGTIRQSNPRARELLGLAGGANFWLAACAPELARGFADWRQDPGQALVLMRIPASGFELHARFIATTSSESDVLAFLENLGHLREHARQRKLAALRRLMAKIAHEIRNPLSAISYAGELLHEERRGEIHDRLLLIAMDNAQRLARIASNVLKLGRRDCAYPELINLRETLPSFVEKFCIKEQLPAELVRLGIASQATLCFDRSHFPQVLWNLVGNALRHSQRAVGSVRLLVRGASASGRVEAHVIDDGEGVNDACREQIFTPFFTTHQHGTGFGLHIARELCGANEAQLELERSGPGADFSLLGSAVGCR